ncbi:BON domain-containing protein [Actinoplanes sp. TRM 88003]|uniref:BON domain-containing protein n=1 Tax=Paractinoplanes aksuensis TaxID=2939490 RepID=A0ABT1E459_9ACTN|nr:BON domain-containing protein [Actinoplanes aksuensis]MCO8277648.1 BON domain-containing protein [Actinoplanes aksuensis]
MVQPLPDDAFLAQQRRRDPVTASRETRLALAAVCGLAEDHRTRHEPIRVSVQNDVVVLAGVVRSSTVRVTAGAVARSVPGARDVCNTLVAPPPAADAFEAIVAELRGESTDSPRNRSDEQEPVGPFTFMSLIALWLALPVTTVALGVSSVTALVITLAGTVIVLPVRHALRWLSSHRRL